MHASKDLTIIIPAKNEEKLLPRLLNSLLCQDYPPMPSTRVFLADAGSSDRTVEAAMDFLFKLNIKVIPGGLPSVGRNAGARLAETRYLLFVDADIELADPTLIRRAVELMKNRELECLTTDIRCRSKNAADRMLYALNNIAQRGSRFFRPFATGMFMMVDKARFDEIGGFDEQALYAEDYQLTRQFRGRRFRVIQGGVYTTNRRFRKMGHWAIVRMFLNTALHGRHPDYFRNSCIALIGRVNRRQDMSAIAEYLLKWDLSLFGCIITRTRRSSRDRLVRTISRSADGQAYPALLTLLVFIHAPEWQKILWAFVLSYALELSLYKILKQSIKRTRPAGVIPGIDQLVVPPDIFSFPSGHTAAAFVAAVLLSHWFAPAAAPMYAWACMVGFSRVYLGVHYPADVVAGASLGIISAKAGLLICSIML